jgi:hypothetical protein
MSKLPFLLTRLDNDIPDVADVSSRLRRHLMRLRGHPFFESDIEAFHRAMDAITDDDVARLRARAQAYVERARAASGTAHLKREEKQRLTALKDGVRAMTFTTTRHDGRSLTQAIADALPGAAVGKAFNMAQARVWADPDKTFDGRQMVTLYTADAGADATIADLIAEVGAAPVRLGGNDRAYQLEAAAAIVIRFLFAGGDAHTILDLIRPEAKPIR